MKKGDKIIVIGVVILAIIAIAWMVFMRLNSNALTLVIEQHSIEIKRIALTEGLDDTFVIQDEDHVNTVIIKNGQVWVEEANCKNQICVKTSKIQYANERIVCLPHQLIISIEGGSATVDTVVN